MLVDNGSTDGTSAVIEEFRQSAVCDTVAVEQPVRGLARSRNAGIRRSRGDIIAFTDDDCYVAPDCLVEIEAAFASRDIGYLGGRVVLYDPTDDPVTTQLRPHPVILEPGSFITPGFIHGANMAVRRAVVDAIGGFDVRLGPGTALFAAEDTEYLTRASACGWRGAYDPRPVVYHHHGRKPGRAAQAVMRGYDYARGAYYASCLFRPTVRVSCLRHLYGELKANVRRRDFGRIARELAGLGRFLLAAAILPTDRAPRLGDGPAR